MGYKQIDAKQPKLLELDIPIFAVEPLHQRVRLCQDNEATCPDNMIAMSPGSICMYTLPRPKPWPWRTYGCRAKPYHRSIATVTLARSDKDLASSEECAAMMVETLEAEEG